MKLAGLTGEQTNSFRFKIMEELNVRYGALKIDCDKREAILINTITQFQDKIDQTT